MTLKIKNIFYFALIISLLQGCSGIRHSYKSKLEQTHAGSVLRVNKGDTTEILAIGNGFPGWWGFYPGLTTSEPNVASITCEKTRSLIPFREPGIIFGGKVCNLVAHKAGTTSLLFGNALNKANDNYTKEFDIIVIDN